MDGRVIEARPFFFKLLFAEVQSFIFMFFEKSIKTS